ncbi:uncharacterized protein LOC116160898 isoform X2 [Photinus pyralis]|uniref:uncharacterized protein LOC116160898 isoform X2 n=1 Tax=Photinus pyralis TaxID=7054 RepID=UPI0012673327|nr:uncharacterized protein LOC116160898 isoform X2 [Photinus pyralis]
MERLVLPMLGLAFGYVMVRLEHVLHRLEDERGLDSDDEDDHAELLVDEPLGEAGFNIGEIVPVSPTRSICRRRLNLNGMMHRRRRTTSESPVRSRSPIKRRRTTYS